MSKRHLMRAAVYLLLQNEEKHTLMIRRYNTGYRDGEWTLPAGHVDPGETFLEAGVREAYEEVGVRILEANLQIAHVMQRHENGVDIVDYYLKVNTWDGKPFLREPHKADAILWRSSPEGEPAIAYITQALEHIEGGVLYSHHGIKKPQVCHML